MNCQAIQTNIKRLNLNYMDSPILGLTFGNLYDSQASIGACSLVWSFYEICQKRYVIEQSVESERQQHHPGHWDGHPLSLLLPGRVSAHCSVVTVSRARPARLRALCGTPRVRLEMLLSWPCPGAHRSAEDGSQGRGQGAREWAAVWDWKWKKYSFLFWFRIFKKVSVKNMV